MVHTVLPVRDGGAAGVRVSRRAVWAMVLGIVAVPTACVGVGAVLGVVAFVLGCAALRAIQKNPRELAGAGFANTGIFGGLGSVLVLVVAVLLPSVGRNTENRNHGYSCAANITGTIKGFVVYANDNNDVFPTPGLPMGEKAYSTAVGTVSTTTSPDEALVQVQSTVGARGNPLSALWMLVLRNQETPKNLICKSDPRANAVPSPTTDEAGKYYLNPREADQISYSIAYPYGSATSVGAWWRNTGLVDLPVMSDMGPLDGTGRPRRDLRGTGVPTDFKTVNSGNHNGDGQFVGFADAHTEWKMNPLCGQGGDDIWTVGTKAGVYGGAVISGGGVPMYPPTAEEPFDTMMVPVRDLDGGGIR